MTEQFLTTAQIARRIGLHEATVRLWMRDGRLPAVKMGSEWRMTEGELTRWMNEKQKVAVSLYRPDGYSCTQYERE